MRRPRICVIGAGAFGGWTALHLARGGAAVTLVDAWGPGNARASSGGDTRVIRGLYGGAKHHTAMAGRALALWRDHESRWGRRILHRTGALWMFSDKDDYARASLDDARESGWTVRELGIPEARGRFPQVRFDGIRTAYFEEEAGYLMAREACMIVRDALLDAGGTYRQASLLPIPAAGALRCADGTSLHADRFLVAAGPWLPDLVPEVASLAFRVTRQEVFYFGTPPGDPRFEEGSMPVWVEMGERFLYGIPGNAHRGFKFADDTRGPPFDPTHGDRRISEEGLARARAACARRFPALDGAPLLEFRVCQYENSADGDFIVDRHPGRADLWIAGGGSGHGFKMGPALGETIADAVLGRREPDRAFRLARFAG